MIGYGFNIKVTVKEINGDCEIHKVGDEILYDGLTFEGKICSSALASLFPHPSLCSGLGSRVPLGRG